MQPRHILIAAIIVVALLDAGTTQIALFLLQPIYETVGTPEGSTSYFIKNTEANPLQAEIVNNPIAAFTVRLLSALIVIIAIRLICPVWSGYYTRLTKRPSPQIDLIAYGACVVGVTPTIVTNVISIAILWI